MLFSTRYFATQFGLKNYNIYIVDHANRISNSIGSEIEIVKIYQDDDFSKESLILCQAYFTLSNNVFRKRMIDCFVTKNYDKFNHTSLVIKVFSPEENIKFYSYHRD